MRPLALTSPAPETRPPEKRRRLKTLAVIVLTCAMIFFIARTLAPQTLGEQARRVFEKQLAAHYVDWDVSIRRGVYRHQVGLQFENITISPKTSIWSALRKRPAVQIDSLTVFADIDPRKMLADESPLRTHRVLIDGVRADASLDREGTFSLAKLWPPPQLGPVCPRIELRNVHVSVNGSSAASTDPAGNRRPIEPRPIPFEMSEITIVNDACHGPQSNDADCRIVIRGHSELFRSIELNFQNTIRDRKTVQMRIDTRLSGLHLTDALFDRLASWLPPSVADNVAFEIAGDVGFHFRKNQTEAGEFTTDYRVDCVVQRGNYRHASFPDAIEGLQGRVVVTPGRIELLPTTTRFGDATLRLEGSTDFIASLIPPESPGGIPKNSWNQDDWVVPVGRRAVSLGFANTQLALRGDDVRIDDRYRSLLPTRAGLFVDRFQPVGRLDLVTTLFNPAPTSKLSKHPWSVTGEVFCDGVDVRFDRFPYPVEQLTGVIKIADGQVSARALTGTVGGRDMRCDLDVPLKLHPQQVVSPEKTVVIQTDGAIPIDDALISALTPRELPGRVGVDPNDRPVSKLESFVRSLQPNGAVELASASIRTDAFGRTTRQFDLRVTGGALRYEKFPYPLFNVDGRIQVQDDIVRIIGFTANNAGVAKIACDGLYQMPADPGDNYGPRPGVGGMSLPSDLNLRFRVADLSMDHSLKVSLPESSRAIWDALSPAGTLDQLDVQIHQTGSSPIDLSLTGVQRASEQSIPNPLSIRPRAVPYRIDINGGRVHYADNRVRIDNLRGRHEGSRLIADGTCQPDASGRWLLSMDLHSGCRLVTDEELITTLPEKMRWAMRGLDLRGPLGVRGKTNILLPTDEDSPAALDWDLVLQLEGNRIGDVGPVHSMRGEIQVAGVSEGDTVRATGDVAIDSVHAYGFQVTSIRGPFAILGDDLRLGTLSGDFGPEAVAKGLAPPPSRRPPIVGQMFGGQMEVSGSVKLSNGDFDVGASLVNGQIATILAELGQTRSGMTGRFDVNSRLDGRLADTDLLKGSGVARISGANLYELPLLVQVLNLLRITPTEDVAFTSGEAEFAIFGEDVNFNRLMLWGDLVALDGSGTLSRREHLDLTFNTRVSPQNLFSKVISPLRDTRYTFWTIEVDGPISAPTIQRHALSGISQTLESWFPAMVRSTTADPQPVTR